MREKWVVIYYINCQNEGELGENLRGFAEVTGGNRLYRERGRNLNICVSSNHEGKQALEGTGGWMP